MFWFLAFLTSNTGPMAILFYNGASSVALVYFVMVARTRVVAIVISYVILASVRYLVSSDPAIFLPKVVSWKSSSSVSSVFYVALDGTCIILMIIYYVAQVLFLFHVRWGSVIISLRFSFNEVLSSHAFMFFAVFIQILVRTIFIYYVYITPAWSVFFESARCALVPESCGGSSFLLFVLYSRSVLIDYCKNQLLYMSHIISEWFYWNLSRFHRNLCSIRDLLRSLFCIL